MATVATVRLDQMSPYGQSVGLFVRSCAAATLGDMATAEAALKPLEALGADGRANLFWARLCRDDLDGAAALLIERLKDPLERGKALLILQDKPALPFASDHDRMLDRRAAALRARPDIVAAVARSAGSSPTAPRTSGRPRPDPVDAVGGLTPKSGAGDA
ncbi:hypothetical protein CSW58_04445 [Caulobacter sp. B11]|uniref:hypothetical protein n=1 Tax=Caulobacter sp. B11 TaxID=2048899 RepID=UPI000C129D39|nr:hypothetical protein [Caulobacter sp. B11]PHY13627.1 hypothetical protein CSW58_04445 [Caulobacter sp. B11]